jgi:hypothetical protein
VLLTEHAVVREAPRVKRLAGNLLCPLREPADRRTPISPRFVPPDFAAGASLATEDDFELGEEFADVWFRAGERLVGFFLGFATVAAAWML